MIRRRGIALMLVNFAMIGGMLFATLLGTLSADAVRRHRAVAQRV